MTLDKTTGESANLRELSDLCTPWCVHVVATLRIADLIAAGTADIKTLAEEGRVRLRLPTEGAQASGGKRRLSGANARSVRAE
jgi:hypothetical protein